jgi:hypothetical protein
MVPAEQPNPLSSLELRPEDDELISLVKMSEATKIVTDNNIIHRMTIIRLEGLQEWVLKQKKAFEKK